MGVGPRDAGLMGDSSHSILFLVIFVPGLIILPVSFNNFFEIS